MVVEKEKILGSGGEQGIGKLLVSITSLEDIFIIVAEEGREKIVSKIKNNLEKRLFNLISS